MPSLYQISLDVRLAVTGILQERQTDRHLAAGRLEGMMETFLWLAGWDSLPLADRYGHAALEVCPRRQAPCRSAVADRCLQADCPACVQDQCVLGSTVLDVSTGA